jgi:hypothetical protein
MGKISKNRGLIEKLTKKIIIFFTKGNIPLSVIDAA